MITKHSKVFSKQTMSFVITAASAGDWKLTKPKQDQKESKQFRWRMEDEAACSTPIIKYHHHHH